MNLCEMDNVGVRFMISSHPKLSTLKEHLFSVWRPDTKEPFWALRGVSLSLKRGESLGIVGRNGSGKSVFCRILSGLMEPDEGTILTRGEITPLLTIGAGFHAELSGRDNIYLNAAFLGIKKREIETKMPEILAFADIGRFIDVPVRTYSSGMLARLGMAVALHMKPGLFVIDEILGVGDTAFVEKSKQKLFSMMEQAASLAIVSHDIDFIAGYCDRALWLDRGSVKALGPAAEVVREYRKFLAVSAEPAVRR